MRVDRRAPGADQRHGQRALFSARTTKAAILQEYQDKLGELLNGETNIATARMEMQQLFDALGYSPERGFPGDEDEDIPPAERGSLRDLRSNKRVDLVLQTNVRQCANYGFWQQGQSDFALFAYPCYELIRIYPRVIPRGMRLSKGALEHVQGEDWPSRWETVGGVFVGYGRMIARKDDPIWQRLGDSAIFPDALDTFLPPFAFGSGYGWREIDRAEAIRLWVIDEETEVEPQERGLNENLQTTVEKIDPALLDAAIADLDVIIADGKARIAAAPASPRLTLKPLPKFQEFIMPDGERLAANAAPFDVGLHPRGKKGRFVRSAIAKDIKAGRRALRISLNQKREIQNVLKRGPYRVDFQYGHPGTTRKGIDDDGFGTSHAASQHATELWKLPVTLARGSWHPHEKPHKVYVVHKHHIAVLKQRKRADGSFSQTRYGLTTHLKDAKTALRASQRAVLIEGR